MSKITDINGSFTLSNGVEMPYLGLGTYQADNDQEVVDAIHAAMDVGYRHIDTAALYGNEAGVGRAIKEATVNREDIFVVTKVWNSDQGYDETLRAFEVSMEKLGLEYLDLYLIHWPVEGKYKRSWKALEKIYADGRVRAIGVSNFLQHQMEDLLNSCDVKPMVNQMEFHPYLVQQSLIDYCKDHGIRYEAWSPFMQGKLFRLDFHRKLCEKYGKSPAQIVLRWSLQKGVITIPKSTNPARIAANADIFDFDLDDDEVAFLDSMDRGERIGPDPSNFDF